MTSIRVKLILAPMHGLADFIMRETLTGIGGFDECVSEFVRITHTVHSRQIWHKQVPELQHNAQTLANTPCTVQLLGSDPQAMAHNACNAVKAGAKKIDLNFGCPAPSVNSHKGGAILLREPQTIYQIVQTVRSALPKEIPLSAKMRLGYDHTDLAVACAQAIESAGADTLTVHARTKTEAYQPPAHWHWIKAIKKTVSIPVVANGDIFTLNDYIALKQQTKCDQVMIGRGALMRPDLAMQIKAYENGLPVRQADWQTILSYLLSFFVRCQQQPHPGKYPVARVKQWLNMLQKTYPEAQVLFADIRTKTQEDDVYTALSKNR